jgi:hypothetical protein
MYRMGIMSIFNSADSQSSTQGDSNNNQWHDSNSQNCMPKCDATTVF